MPWQTSSCILPFAPPSVISIGSGEPGGESERVRGIRSRRI
jgi:hypothetical protein